MILGFTLPFALAFVAIPLEYFINSGRIVLGATLVLFLRGLAFALRFSGQIVKEAGKLAGVFYDVIIFAPLAIERWVAAARENAAKDSPARPRPALGKFATADNEEAL